MSTNASLTSRQRKALRSLLVRPTIQLAAEDCGTAESTLYRWLQEDDFRQALTKAEDDAIDHAARRLVRLTDAALGIIALAMGDSNAHMGIRLKAAELVLSNMLRLVELRTVEQRLADVEIRLNEQFARYSEKD
jgi:hypothetical protein